MVSGYFNKYFKLPDFSYHLKHCCLQSTRAPRNGHWNLFANPKYLNCGSTHPINHLQEFGTKTI